MSEKAVQRTSFESEGGGRSIPFRVQKAMPTLFFIWLLVTVLGPHKMMYRVVFHAVLIPALLIVLCSGYRRLIQLDPFLKLFLAFIAYTSLSTFLVGTDLISLDVEIFRWGIEAAFGLLVFWLCMPAIVSSPLLWARLFLLLAFLGSLGGFLFGPSRMAGLGVLYNPVQAASILMVYFAMGHFLLVQGETRWRWSDLVLVLVSFTAVAAFVFLSRSRGPILTFVIYALFLLPLSSGRRHLWTALGVVGIAVLISALTIELTVGLEGFLERLIARGGSHRLEIWKGYLMHPPESLLLGYGAGTPPEQMKAAELFWKPNGYIVTHAHNLWIGTFAESGLIGLGFLLAIFGFLAWNSVWTGRDWTDRFGLLTLLALVIMLTMTGEHTLVVSLKPIWIFGWLPLLLVWFWSRYGPGRERELPNGY